MKVQELNDLANWFKANVLDLSEDDDMDIGATEDEALEYESDAYVILPENSHSNAIARHNDEQDLFEFIIGVDGM